MSEIVKSPTPKQRFIDFGEKMRTAHRDYIGTVSFQVACDHALLEYQRILSAQPAPNYNDAAAAHLKMTGAQDFIEVFRRLAETSSPIAMPRPAGNLNHNA